MINRSKTLICDINPQKHDLYGLDRDDYIYGGVILNVISTSQKPEYTTIWTFMTLFLLSFLSVVLFRSYLYIEYNRSKVVEN